MWRHCSVHNSARSENSHCHNFCKTTHTKTKTHACYGHLSHNPIAIKTVILIEFIDALRSFKSSGVRLRDFSVGSRIRYHTEWHERVKTTGAVHGR